jgi:hypothetical protein
MAQRKQRGRSRRRLSLSVRLSLLVLFAALLPLAAVVGINDYFARGTLLDQGHRALSTDANAKVTLVETYMRERLLDGAALASLPTAVAFVSCSAINPPPPQLACDVLGQQYKDSVTRALAVGMVRDSNYSQWTIYDPRGHLLDSSSPDAIKDKPTVPQEDLSPVVKQGKQWISAVYYNPDSQHAFVRLYTPIVPDPTKPTKGPVLGFLQATLRLDSIWSIVKGEQGANGKGSYAFITDENGVRIADLDPGNLFTAVSSIDPTTEQLITTEQRFGTTNPVERVDLPGVAASLNKQDKEDTFEGIATPGSAAEYQFVRIRLTSVPWTYFVLSPVTTVTQVADDQVKLSLISAGVVALLAILLGLLVGRGTTSPVRSSVAELEGAALALKDLASRQENSASEQHWVVDACRTGLESVRYLSNAMDQAAHRIVDASNWFNEYWDRLTEDQALRTVQHLRELAHYIDEGARRQQASSERLDKAIGVTMQVSNQLVSGAAAAARSADQLEQVVSDLQHVVGGRIPSPPMLEIDPDQGMGGAPAPNPPMMPAPQAPRQMMPAPQYMPPGQAMLPEPRQAAPSRAAMRGAPSQWNPGGPPNPRSRYGGDYGYDNGGRRGYSQVGGDGSDYWDG